MKNMKVAIDDLKGHIQLVWRFSERNASSSDCSAEDRRYILDNLDLAPDIRLIAWSY